MEAHTSLVWGQINAQLMKKDLKTKKNRNEQNPTVELDFLSDTNNNQIIETYCKEA